MTLFPFKNHSVLLSVPFILVIITTHSVTWIGN